ncbi:hypothetical protein DMA15_03905 [Streptomyces sp. WAC 01529]|uniref:hypothetical protein n=1 Tax=Streptomyces sp. WAC 01529 TaxID=2203205 RepID=UPI000F6CDFC6|nr:hypothetical protein [Streptomyces sp. WAC 01529]AZM51837.1 hypothetical protein DMA15_03905 [Streptomyces sp. WAC 01529]
MKTTVAEYLVTRGLPADWRYASPFGRIAAETYRSVYRREPRKAFRLINGRFRRVMAYRASERHVLDTAYEIYPRTATPDAVPTPRHTVARISGAMRWTPSSAPLTRHP